MGIFGPQPGNTIDADGIHRDPLGRRRTLLDIAADSFVVTEQSSRDIAAVLDRWKPAHLLTQAELDARLGAERQAARLMGRRKHLHDSGVVRVLAKPADDIAAIVAERMVERPALSFVRAWWADGEPFRPWLVLGGTIGVGKTWAGAWVLADRGGRYISAAELIRAHQARAAARGPVQTPIADAAWQRIVSAAVLVLDELGREPWAQTAAPLHDLVNERGARPTLVLSNVSSADIRRAFESGDLDRRTASRLAPLALRDAAGRACWDVTGADMRAA
jgi:hypothetical protein